MITIPSTFDTERRNALFPLHLHISDTTLSLHAKKDAFVLQIASLTY